MFSQKNLARKGLRLSARLQYLNVEALDNAEALQNCPKPLMYRIYCVTALNREWMI